MSENDCIAVSRRDTLNLLVRVSQRAGRGCRGARGPLARQADFFMIFKGLRPGTAGLESSDLDPSLEDSEAVRAAITTGESIVDGAG